MGISLHGATLNTWLLGSLSVTDLNKQIDSNGLQAESEMLSVSDLSKRWCCSKRHVNRMVDSGKCPKPVHRFPEGRLRHPQ